MTEGPREDRQDPTEGTDEGPTEPEARPEPEATHAPQPEPAPPPEPEPEPEPRPADQRPASLFVVAARQPAEVEPDEDVLYVVPAPQPAIAPAPPTLPPGRPAPRPAPEPDWDPEPAPEPEPQPRRRRRPGCFAYLLLLLIAIVAGAGYAYQTGVLTPRLVLNAAGFAAAEVEFVNLRDTRVSVNLALANTAGESFPAAIRLEPYDIATHRAPRPNDLSVTVVGPDGASLATCLLRIRAGDRFRIVVLPDRSLIQRGDAAPADTRDLLLATSSLCR